MSIPTYEERIEAKFGKVLTNLRDSINNAILTGNQHYHNRGYYYYIARVGDEWPDEELREWIEDEYMKAGWSLNFTWTDSTAEVGPVLVEINSYKR